MTRRSVVFATLAACAAVLGGPAAQAQQAAWPARPVTLVVPFPPGGGTDTGARLVAQRLAQKWGQAVLVENKGGAAGALGADMVAKARPDGYTLMMGNIGTQAINPSLYRKLPYNPDTAFAPITLVADLPLLLLVNPSVPAKTPKELVAWIRSRPGQTTYSTSGSGGSMHLAAELFEDMSGTQMLYVPYKGGGPAISDLIAGHVNVSFATVLESVGFVKAGRLRALAVTGARRSPALPDVPTVAESALPGYESASWIGLLAPAGTPAAIVDKVAADTREVLSIPEVRDTLVAQGAIPAGNTPAQFQALIDKDRARYAKIIREKNITVE